MAGGVGVGVKMLHVFGDKLWCLEPSVTLQVPIKEPVFSVPKDEDFPALGAEPATGKLKAVTVDTTNQTENGSTTVNSNEDNPENQEEVETEYGATEEPDDASPPPTEESMDDVLRAAFMVVLKRDGKKLQLPILTSNFYRCHIVPAASRTIDLKQTTYKKISKFLQQMASENYLTLKEEQKGVEKIYTLNINHTDLENYVLPAIKKQQDGDANADEGQLFVSEMVELFLVTEETAKFFAHVNLAMGQGVVNPSQLKRIVKDYVCKRHLQDPLDIKIIQLDDMLAATVGRDTGDRVPFDQLLRAVSYKMTHTYEMRSKNELKSGKQTHITMTLATRSGNKKVTLVDNLQAYGIRLDQFAKSCKIGVAASTSIIKNPQAKSDQFLVQGNQVKFIYALLTETYKIPPKNILGKELAGKEKKKKK